MKPDADRSELLGQVIEMLLSDREKALSTGNITAAITASKTVADLLALRIQRAPEDEDEASPIAMEDLDARQIGRAILAIFGEATLEDVEGDGAAHAPMPPAKHMVTATRYEEVDEIDALDLSDTPAPAGVGPPIGDEVGERDLVGTRGDEIRCIEVRGGRSRWAIISHRGEHITSMWATRDDARRACEQFIETGMISR